MKKVGIIGYGNLGKAIERSVLKEGQQLVAIFSKRKVISPFGTCVEDYNSIEKYVGIIDIMYLCVGSYSDIEIVAPQVLATFNTVDSFDTHSKISKYKDRLQNIAKDNQKVAIIACGWDPGLMSLMRHIFSSIGDKSPAISFWGKGVSQGHSDAIRRIEGVTNAIQYTLPIASDIAKAKRGQIVNGPRHTRLCYVSIKQGANKENIKKQIMSMPNYFADYKTTVKFVDNDIITKLQSNMYHKGKVYKTTNVKDKQIKLSFELEIESNPDFCSAIMIAYSRAIPRLLQQGQFGAYNVFDIPLKLIARDDLYIDNL